MVEEIFRDSVGGEDLNNIFDATEGGNEDSK